jgi:chromosome segregation ATPase
MKPVKVIAKKSLMAKFILLQVLTVLLVAATLVSFSDISLAPLTSRTKPVTETATTNLQGTENGNTALREELKESQKQLDDKQAKINELEKQLQALQNTKQDGNTASANEEVLKSNLQQLQLQLTDRETKIKELENAVKNLQRSGSVNTASADKATVEKLRTQVQQLETRNALLVKLNDDLKKNNAYLATQLKAAGAGN